MMIEFSKAWGQDENRYNYCGGDWNFHTMAGLMQFYGIKEAWIDGKDSYWEDDKEIECNNYCGLATKNIELIKKHYVFEYCKPSFEIKRINI